MSCTQGMSDDEYNNIRNRIPSGIEYELSVAFDEDHPDFKNAYYRGFCDVKHEDDKHLECRRRKGHKGKHWCFECGESW